MFYYINYHVIFIISHMNLFFGDEVNPLQHIQFQKHLGITNFLQRDSFLIA